MESIYGKTKTKGGKSPKKINQPKVTNPADGSDQSAGSMEAIVSLGPQAVALRAAIDAIGKSRSEFDKKIDRYKTGGGIGKGEVKRMAAEVFDGLIEELMQLPELNLIPDSATQAMPKFQEQLDRIESTLEMVARQTKNADQPGSKMFDQMNRIEEKMKTLATKEFSKKAPASYAEAAGAVAGGRQNADVSVNNRFAPLERLIIEIDPEVDDVTMMKKLEDTLSPKSTKIRVQKIVKAKDRWKLDLADAESKKKARQKLSNSNFRVVDPGEKPIDLLIRGLPTREMATESGTKEILDQSDLLERTEKGQVHFISAIVGKNFQHVRIRAPKPIARKLVDHGRVFIGLYSCPVKLFVSDPRQCFKCQEYGHMSRDCKATEEICAYCSQKHRSGTCELKMEKMSHCCILCSNRKYDDVKHSTMSRDCPVRQEELQKQAEISWNILRK